LELNSGCEIFDEPGAKFFGRRSGIIVNWVGREMVSDRSPGGAQRANNIGHERHTVEKSEKSENAGS
jgi:hypothetical protein